MYIKRQECYFAGDTLIETDQGPIKIKDIVDNKMNCKVLSLVWDSGEYKYKERYYNIAKYYKKDLDKPVIGIKPEFTSRRFKKNFSVICTDEVSFEFDYHAALGEVGSMSINSLEYSMEDSSGKFTHIVYNKGEYDDNAVYGFFEQAKITEAMYNITLSEPDKMMLANGIAVLGMEK